MSSVLGFIPDAAYTESVWVNEVPHLYPKVEFDFSPMGQDELVAYWKASGAYEGMPLRTFVAGILAGKVKRWDLKDQHGNPLIVNVENLLKLKNPLFNRLFSVVSLQEPADGHKSRADGDADAEAQDLLKSIQEGRPLAEVRAERLAKN